MRFLLTFLMDPAALPDAELSNRCFAEMMSFVDELTRSGQLLFDSQVVPEPAAARITGPDPSEVVRRPASELVVGGVFVISAPTHADALAIARRCPHTQVGPVELHALNETTENAYP